MSTVADGAPPTSTPTTTTPPQQSPPADQPPSEPPADRTTPRPESPAEPEPCLRVEAPPPDADINIDACLDEVLAITGNA